MQRQHCLDSALPFQQAGRPALLLLVLMPSTDDPPRAFESQDWQTPQKLDLPLLRVTETDIRAVTFSSRATKITLGYPSGTPETLCYVRRMLRRIVRLQIFRSASGSPCDLACRLQVADALKPTYMQIFPAMAKLSGVSSRARPARLEVMAWSQVTKLSC